MALEGQHKGKITVLEPCSPWHFPGPRLAGVANDWCTTCTSMQSYPLGQKMIVTIQGGHRSGITEHQTQTFLAYPYKYTGRAVAQSFVLVLAAASELAKC